MDTIQSGCVPGMVCDSEWNVYAREEERKSIRRSVSLQSGITLTQTGQVWSVAPYDGDDLEDLRQRK